MSEIQAVTTMFCGVCHEILAAYPSHACAMDALRQHHAICLRRDTAGQFHPEWDLAAIVETVGITYV